MRCRSVAATTIEARPALTNACISVITRRASASRRRSMRCGRSRRQASAHGASATANAKLTYPIRWNQPNAAAAHKGTTTAPVDPSRRASTCAPSASDPSSAERASFSAAKRGATANAASRTARWVRTVKGTFGWNQPA
jgi:hypothetical protein